MAQELLDRVNRWFLGATKKARRLGVALEYHSSQQGDQPEHSARIDLMGLIVAGRATVWDVGTCDLEILSIETGKGLSYVHLEEVPAELVEEMLDNFLQRVAETVSE